MRKIVVLFALTLSILGASTRTTKANPPSCGDNCPLLK